MKHTKNLFLAIIVALFANFAFATNTTTPPPPTCDPKKQNCGGTTDPLKLQLQGQLQFQGQQQGQLTDVDVKTGDNTLKSTNVSDSKATATGGKAAVTGSGNSASKSESGVIGAGNSNLTNGIAVDASDRSGGDSYTDQSKVLFIPPVVPATPPSVIGTPQVSTHVSACGPLQSIVRTPVAGTFYGVFSTDKTEQGWTEDLAPYVDDKNVPQEYLTRDAYGGVKVFYGHQVTMFTTVVGVANARHVALGGGGTGGNWGQGGTGTSATNQQMVTTIKLRLCEIGRITPTAAAQPLPPATPPVAPAPLPTVKTVAE